MVWRRWGLATLWVSGCYAPKDDALVGGSYMEEDFPPWSCMDGSTTGPCASSGDTPATPCEASSECPTAEVCLGVFDGDIGALHCGPLCVLDDDETSWCSDDAACCNAEASCVRGMCIADDGSTTTAAPGSTGGSTT